ncbi:MAG: protein kinase domain-containing protein, partial [Vicinamibacterales bacterium]
MTLNTGTRLGAYEIVALLGAGGMGEVYRARDTRLDRTVAIKVLPADVASTPERRERFEREARTVAALNHPHICVLHDVGRHDGVDFLVMEYLDGETLQQRLQQKGPMSLEHALQVAVQIADALATAHRAGVVHRDLKPGNIMLLRRSGPPVAKLLDFGLAKSGPPAAAGTASMLPTTPAALTAQGTILGTFQYMAPEQVEGLDADARSDIFAFGAVLYEMVTGRKAFEARSHASLIAAILEHEPPALSKVRPEVPRQLEHVVGRCLAKASEERWQTAADLHRELQWVVESIAVDTPRAEADIEGRGVALVRRPVTLGVAALAVLFAATVAGTVAWLMPRTPTTVASRVARVTIALPAGEELDLAFPAVAVSPAGTHIAYVATSEGRQQLHLRAIGSADSTVLAGTELATNPFFSPDGQWIGFFAQGKLKKVSVATGATQTLGDALYGVGGSWHPDGSIYFAATNSAGISKVSGDGGTPTEVTRLDRGRGEVSHRWPQVLPGGRAVMFTMWTGPGEDEAHVYLQRLDTGERVAVVQGGGTGRYVSSGHVVYARGDELFAVPFALESLQVSGQPVRLTDAVRGGGEGAHYAVSDAGELVFQPGNPLRYERRLVWVTRDGRVEPLTAPTRPYYANAVISPDGRFAAVDIEAGTIGIWIYDFSRATLTPLTTGSGSSQVPRWTADGKRIVYRGTRTGFRNLWWKTVDDATSEERLTTGANIDTPGSWSADGQWLVYNAGEGGTSADVWALPGGGDRNPRVVVQTSFTERFARLSPDGRWLAYTSDEPGRVEVFVQPFPGPGGRTQISTDGGTEPVWSSNGRELFYINGDRMMAVDVTTTPVFKAGTPRLLFEGRYIPSPNGVAAYDVSRDGQRFLRVQPLHPDPPTNQ